MLLGVFLGTLKPSTLKGANKNVLHGFNRCFSCSRDVATDQQQGIYITREKTGTKGEEKDHEEPAFFCF